MISALLLLTLQAVPFAANPLAAEGYEHSWVLVDERKHQSGWVDQNWAEEFKYEGSTFPVVLMRVHVTRPNSNVLADMRAAIDCKEERAAMIGATLYDRGGQLVESKTMATTIFDFAPTGPSDDFYRVLKIACGGKASE